MFYIINYDMGECIYLAGARGIRLACVERVRLPTKLYFITY